MRLRLGRLRRWPAWLAMWAIVFQSLLPAAHAATRDAADRVPVCTATGLAWIDVGGGAPAPLEAAKKGHCPLCLGQGPLGLPRASAAATLIVAGCASVVPLETGPGPLASAEAAPPPSRAPPRSS